MSKWFVFVFLFLVFTTTAFAQTPPTTSPTPAPTPNQEAERQRQIMERYRRDETMRRLDNIKSANAIRRPLPASVLYDVKQLYRGSSSSELSKLSIDPSDINDSRTLLQQKNTGIVRLVPGSNCGDATMVISADSNCMKYTMPGNGSYYSFRKGDYSIGRIADLHFIDNTLRSSGLLQHVLMTGLGDVPILNVDTTTNGMKFLIDFAPSKEIATAKQTTKEIFEGINNGGFYYSHQLNLVDNMTYAMRVVAYRTAMFRSFNGFIYDEADFDKRIDLLVVFRVIRKHDDGSITMVWKQLDKKRSPQLKPGKDEKGTLEVNRFMASKSSEKQN